VAMDTIGWDVVEKARKENGLKSLTASRREPTYIAKAADLGLGVHDRNKIRMKEVTA
jgi:hypothetical protein